MSKDPSRQPGRTRACPPLTPNQQLPLIENWLQVRHCPQHLPESLQKLRRRVLLLSPHFTDEKTDRFFKTENFLIHTEPSSKSIPTDVLQKPVPALSWAGCTGTPEPDSREGEKASPRQADALCGETLLTPDKACT